MHSYVVNFKGEQKLIIMKYIFIFMFSYKILKL